MLSSVSDSHPARQHGLLAGSWGLPHWLLSLTAIQGSYTPLKGFSFFLDCPHHLQLCQSPTHPLHILTPAPHTEPASHVSMYPSPRSLRIYLCPCTELPICSPGTLHAPRAPSTLSLPHSKRQIRTDGLSHHKLFLTPHHSSFPHKQFSFSPHPALQSSPVLPSFPPSTL